LRKAGTWRQLVKATDLEKTPVGRGAQVVNMLTKYDDVRPELLRCQLHTDAFDI
jgi:hypothetical protein